MTTRESMRRMERLDDMGVVKMVYTRTNMPGRKWYFTPAGFSERSLTTSQVQDFILGAEAVLASPVGQFAKRFIEGVEGGASPASSNAS